MVYLTIGHHVAANGRDHKTYNMKRNVARKGVFGVLRRHWEYNPESGTITFKKSYNTNDPFNAFSISVPKFK